MGRDIWGTAVSAVLAVTLIAPAAAHHLAGFAQPPPASDTRSDFVGNDACRPCHSAIVTSYERTAMAQTSGPARGHVVAGTFTHPSSGIRYTISEDQDGAALTYQSVHDKDGSGRVALDYYVGSNTRGRTYLFAIDGFLFQSPVNYYALRSTWDMSPGYERVTTLPLNHPVDATCLFCHASAVQPVSAGTANRFVGAPFLQSGVGCERCHGAGGSHIRDPRPETIINPARLSPEARDSVCMQCHLEGLSRIARSGHRVDDFRPGQRLGDILTVFISATRDKQTPGAVSHVESLAASRCKQASGDRMTCSTCHDPHRTPAAAERAEYYRQRCLSCHAPLANDHHPAERRCTVCHMPRLESPDVSHTAVTDHRILRKPRVDHDAPAPAEIRLAPFGPAQADPRDLGLAYAEIAPRGGAYGQARAMELLQRSAESSPADSEVLTRLGFLRHQRGEVNEAEDLYRRALNTGASQPVAAANLAVIRAGQGALGEALSLWQASFDVQPYVEEIGLNLALAQCLAGQEAKAAVTVDRLLRFHPDSSAARALREEIAQKNRCARHKS